MSEAPLPVLPLEIWEKVIGYVDCMKDCKSVSLTCTWLYSLACTSMWSDVRLGNADGIHVVKHLPIQHLDMHNINTYYTRLTCNESHVAAIADLTELRSLKLGIQSAVSVTALKRLSSLTKLQDLHIDGENWQIAACLSSMVQLRKLCIRSCITDIGLSQLSSLKYLKCLDIRRVSKVTPDWLKNIDKDSLEELHMRATDEHLAVIGSFCKLKVLIITGSKCTDVGLTFLSGLKLRILDISHCSLTRTGLKLIQKDSLEELDMSVSCTDEHLAVVASFHNLKVLNITRSNCTDVGLAFLSGLKLQIFVISHCSDLTSAGLKHIHKDSLQELRMDDSCTDEHLALVASFHNLKVLDIWSKCTDVGLAFLSGLKLRILDISQCSNLTPDGLKVIHKDSLEELDMSVSCTDEHLAVVASFHKLKVLDITGSNCTDVGLAFLSGLKELRHFYILDCQNLTANGTAPFKNIIKKDRSYMKAAFRL